MNLFAELDRRFNEHFANLPRPIAPQPTGPVSPVSELPTDRSDFTRDDAATGV